MIVTCDKCETRYKVDETSVVTQSFRVKCNHCGDKFVVHKPSSHVSETSQAETSVNSHQSETQYNTGLGNDKNTGKSEKCHIITICNQKGGVAKTSTCLNLGSSLALLNKRVLLVDFDVQANLSLLLGYQDAHSFFDVMHSSDIKLAECIIKTGENLFLLPSNSKMALLSKKHLGSDRFEYLLSEKLEEIKEKFDFIIIDTPPSGDFYTLNALLASDSAIVTTQCEYLSMNGVSHIEDLISVLQEKASHNLEYKILITLYKSENTASRAVLKNLMGTYGDRILKPAVSYDEKIQESQIVRQPALVYDRNSRAARQYFQIAKGLAGNYATM